ncbi:D-cysteine desulfhydrase family protein [Clostridium magnum]|uniref:L-cysteate sulfo-lyase n=1 Tax=Clostridium magnum DSM 2767 TaxID=1121326 RepID=A0A162R0X2_9CLOT|nr:D-cysteine desulfhydrase family protein [Clostridium magnum]KZL89255.1 L-cysteate sulfo-lyase [Clostridium magnum DSM 2767]SHI97362.1 D-cysteine desulfhydrase [Clostridium magnum DSM 2767]
MSTETIFKKINNIPRRHYIKEATPLQKLPNLSKELGGEVEIYIKRDDLLPFSGNKVRKLEFLFQEAVDQGADTIITGSTVQCNHNLMALLIANMEGMKTELIMEYWAKADYEYNLDPNKHLYELGGVSKVDKSIAPIVGPLSDMELTQKMKRDLEAEGKNPYILARGGTCSLGNCGYVLCANEILQQAKEMNVDFDYLVCPSGTGGTQMGLLIGFHSAQYTISVMGVNVFQNKEMQLKTLYGALEQTSSYLNVETPSKDKVLCYEEYYGKGYAQPTVELKEAIELLARTEGIMLDPIYSGKTLAGLIGLIKKGEIKKGSKVIFLHTGGLPTYYDYSSMKEAF